VRQRRAIVRRISTVATPSSVYSARTDPKVTQIPLAPVTPAVVRIVL
jgi:hypothetical protein